MRKGNLEKLRFIFSVIFIFSAVEINAGWHDAGKVTRVHSGHGNGPFAFSTETNINISGCTEENVGYFINESNSASDRIYSLLLAAYFTGKPIAISTTGQCISGRPEINAVQLKDTTYF